MLYGCHTDAGRSDDCTRIYINENGTIGIRSCDVGTCAAGYSCTRDEKIYSQRAFKIGPGMGMTIYAQEEPLSEICCYAGSKCDCPPVWTFTEKLAGMQFFFLDSKEFSYNWRKK